MFGFRRHHARLMVGEQESYRPLAFILTLVAAACLVLAPAALASGGQAPSPTSPNPLVGQQWWDQNTEYNPTWRGYRSLEARGRRADAAKVLQLALTPQFRWWGRWESPVGATMRMSFGVMDRTAPGSVPLIVAFGHEGKGCGPSYLGGGAAEDRRFEELHP